MILSIEANNFGLLSLRAQQHLRNVDEMLDFLSPCEMKGEVRLYAEQYADVERTARRGYFVGQKRSGISRSATEAFN